MWIMTSWGVLHPSLRKPSTISPGDDRVIQVRARRAQDLDRLRSTYMPDTLGSTIRNIGTDYEFRAFCTPDALADAMAAITRDINYTSFKDTTTSQYGDKQLHDLYLSVWGVIYRALASPLGKKHYESHWHSTTKTTTSTRVMKSGTRRGGDWWDAEEPDALADGAWDSYDDLLFDDITDDAAVIRRSNGTIDHIHCTHVRSRNARRRCLRANGGVG